MHFMLVALFMAVLSSALGDVGPTITTLKSSKPEKRDSADQTGNYGKAGRGGFGQVSYQSSFSPSSGPFVLAPHQHSNYKAESVLQYAPSAVVKDGGIQYASSAFRGPVAGAYHQSAPPTASAAYYASPSQSHAPHHSSPPSPSSATYHVSAPLQSSMKVYSEPAHSAYHSAQPSYSQVPIQYVYSQPQSPAHHHQQPQIQYYAISADAFQQPHRFAAYAMPAQMIQYAYASPSQSQAYKHQPVQYMAPPSAQYAPVQYVMSTAQARVQSNAVNYAAPQMYYHAQPQPNHPSYAYTIQPSAPRQASPPYPPQPSTAAIHYQQAPPPTAEGATSFTKFSKTLLQVQPADNTHATVKISSPSAVTPQNVNVYPSSAVGGPVYSSPHRLTYVTNVEAAATAPAAAAAAATAHAYNQPPSVHYGTHLYHPSAARIASVPSAHQAVPPSAPSHPNSAVVKYP